MPGWLFSILVPVVATIMFFWAAQRKINGTTGLKQMDVWWYNGIAIVGSLAMWLIWVLMAWLVFA